MRVPRLSTSSRFVLATALLAVGVMGLAGARSGGDHGATPGPGQAVHSATPAAPSTGPTDPIRPSSTPTTPLSTTPGAGATEPTRTPSSTPPVTPASTPTRSAAIGSSLAALLALLSVASEDRSGYERSLFEHWIDADGDGCDTRREVLIDESLTPVTVGPGCWLTGGTWRSLYDGVTTTEAGTFDIDHVVALAEAWDSGASAWTPDRRARFANDLEVDWALIAVTAGSNRGKSDRDPSDWLPPLAGVRCDYVAMWIAVKVRWQLTIDAAEAGALDGLIDGCDAAIVVVPAP